MKRTLTLLTALLLAPLTTNSQGANLGGPASSDVKADVTFQSLLNEMVDRSVVTHDPVHPYRSLQASSYNRDQKSPDAPGWFANGDCGFCVRTDLVAGRTEYVLMEHDGPGVLTRIWTPFFHYSLHNKKGTNVRIYLDGAATPTITTNFIELVTGQAFVPAPFAQSTVRAGDLYLPIPFQKSCRVTLEDKPFFYIINYRAYDKPTRVETFRREFLATYATLLKETGAKLVNAADELQGQVLTLAKEIGGKQVESLDLPKGPSAIRHLEIRLQSPNLAQALRSTVLEMRFDDDVSAVWCPVGDFFSNVNALDPYRMWEREVRADGTMICRWIMPYRSGGALRLHNLTAAPVTVNAKVVVSAWKWDDHSLYFRANWWTAVPCPPRPVWDMNFIEVKGRGLHVGDTLVVLNPHWSWWGEGDEKIYVDDDIARRFPSQLGTGSEDYYGWAGGEVPTRKDEFSSPFLANVRVGGQERGAPPGKGQFTHGYNICTRTRSLDATPFKETFKFDMEAFNMIATPDAYLQYALVTYWYGAPGATHNRLPLANAAAAPVPQTEDVEAYAVAALTKQGKSDFIKDAIELESLKEVRATPGLRWGPQQIGDKYPPHKWSNAAQFFAQATKPGHAATFTLHEQYLPRRIILYPTVADDYGRLNIYVNDQLVKQDWDGYAPQPKPGEPIDLGVHKPDGNVFRLTVEVTGKNQPSRAFYFGLDCVVLQAVDATRGASSNPAGPAAPASTATPPAAAKQRPHNRQ